MRAHLPLAGSGQRIGLLGGSFDPAHEGHVHITRAALKRFELDAIWWLVTPGNPLKTRGPAPLERRLTVAREIMQHPRVHVTDLERHLGTRYTSETLRALRRVAPDLRFAWLMGADNLASFHRWQDWAWIMENVPVGVLARPGDRLSALRSQSAQRYVACRLPGRASATLMDGPLPRWCYVNLPLNGTSSSSIRARGRWS